MENKSKLNTVLLVIIIILLVVGLGYVIFNKKEQKEENILPPVENQNIPLENSDVLQDKKVEDSTTYTYSNHGFTIELPKGFVPKEIESADKNINILLPNSTLVYIPNVALWEKIAGLPQNKYVKDQKIGETIFSLYSYDDGKFYWFKQGNVGYYFRADIEEDMKTFKFIGWAQN